MLYLGPGDNGAVINFEIIPVCNNCGRDYCDNLACRGESDVQYAKLINEEKSTKRSKQKKFTNIMEHNNIKRMYTEEDIREAITFGQGMELWKEEKQIEDFINSLNKG